MINKFKYLLLGVMLALALGFYLPNKEAGKKDKVALNLIYSVLNTSHFAPKEMNDEFSSKVFDHFIETLDYNKRFLLQEDLKELEKYRTSIDDEIKKLELNFFEEAYSKYDLRFSQTSGYYKDILTEPFDFTVDEQLETDDEKLEFAKNEKELKDRWRKYLKHRVLVRIEEDIEEQERAKEENDTTVEVRTFEELEKKAREKEVELHDTWFKNLESLEHFDWVGAYLNSITNVYDPHTQYFPPTKQEDFEISMTGQIEGIGAQLQPKGDYITVAKIITGSPCWKQGDLEVGDKLLKVAEGDEEALDLVGMNVTKAVQYIRGPKGTEVRLTVQKVDGSKMIIPIIRDVVELEATFAKSAVIGEGEEKVGYIKLPKFYVDFYNESNRNCAEDVKKELEKLKKENVNGVILDLRNNGGGSLQGVIDIVGLFIEDGPVVQVKAPGKAPKVLEDRDDDIVYDGPLVVMVNQFSASASEIFAAAIQDYKRGLIIGSKSTFGKGTVQNVFDMDRAVGFNQKDVKPLGALKLTIQKYYRINGGTPQLRGVQPDIILPDNYNYLEFGEKEQEYALPYDEIGSAEYSVWTKGIESYDQAISSSAIRVKENDKFSLIDEYAMWLKEEREQTTVSLNYEEFRKENVQFREKSKKYEGMRKAENELTVSSSLADMEAIKVSDDPKEEEEKRDRFHKNLSKDLYLHEAIAVAQDLK